MNFNQWKIILAEDDFDSSQMISMILEHYGIEVHLTKNGAECLRLLETITPTVVVLDLMMPELDGWATLEKIRSNPRTADVPTVAVTAYYSVEMAEEARVAG